MSNYMPYVHEKDFRYLDHRWTLQMNKKYSVDVFVWKTLNALQKNTQFRNKDYCGAYIGLPERKKSGLFGEVHLLKNKIGAGYVSHELMHLVFDWMVQRDMREYKSGQSFNERTAYLMSNLTNEFWNKFYEFYDVVPSANAKLIPDDR
jgi:hypothetical protein